MRAKNASPKSKLQWLADAEQEKLKHQNLRAPDSRALLNQNILQVPKSVEPTSIEANAIIEPNTTSNINEPIEAKEKEK